MAQIRFPAGTDVAEMAFFDVDAIPKTPPLDEADFGPLISQQRLVRFPTGGDGGYLLHVFIDEPIPTDIQRYCLVEDTLVGTFATSAGRVAFGGLESAYVEFKPNPNIRSDGEIEPGCYAFTAYKTEFPDELVTQALRVERTIGERWIGLAPIISVLGFVCAGLVLVVMRRFALAGIAVAACYFAVKLLRGMPSYKRLKDRREEAQLAFPSIVMEMRSNFPPKPLYQGEI